MSVHSVDKKLLKRIFDQVSGKLTEEDIPIPELAIQGSGYIWCFDPTAKSVVRVARGIKCYILDASHDDLGRIMVYTINNDVILIEEDELIYTGFD
jgi:hypothetical protein